MLSNSKNMKAGLAKLITFRSYRKQISVTKLSKFDINWIHYAYNVRNKIDEVICSPNKNITKNKMVVGIYVDLHLKHLINIKQRKNYKELCEEIENMKNIDKSVDKKFDYLKSLFNSNKSIIEYSDQIENTSRINEIYDYVNKYNNLSNYNITGIEFFSKLVENCVAKSDVYVSGLGIRGCIDLLLEKNGEYEVVDIKYSSFDNSAHINQILLYSTLLAMKEIRVKKISIWNVQSGIKTSWNITIPTKMFYINARLRTDIIRQQL